MPNTPNASSYDPADLASEFAQIDADMKYAVQLPFGQYIAYLAWYGDTLRKMAARHPAPEIAFLRLRVHADAILDQLNNVT